MFPDATGTVAHLVEGGAHGAGPWEMPPVNYAFAELRYRDAPEYFHMAVCFPEGRIMVGSPRFGCVIGVGQCRGVALGVGGVAPGLWLEPSPNSSFAQRGGQGVRPASTCSSSTCGARSVSEDVPGSV